MFARVRKLNAAALLASGFAPCVLLLILPNGVILPNLRAVGYFPELSLAFLLLFLASWGLAVHFAVSARAVRSLVFLGAIPLVSAATGTLASRLHLPAAGIIGVEAFLLTVAFMAVRRVRLPTLQGWSALVAGVNLLWVPIEHGLTIHRYLSASPSPEAPRAPAPDRAGSGLRGNVYHLVLDAYQREDFEALIDRDPEKRPEGFTLYRQFRANYGVTMFSIASAIHGKTHVASDMDTTEWAFRPWSNTDTGIWGDLHAGGYALSFYTTDPFRWNALGASVYPRSQLQREELRRHPRNTLVDLWFLNTLPYSLRRAITDSFSTVEGMVGHAGNDYGFSITDRIASKDEAVFQAMGWHDFLKFKRLLEDEAGRPSANQYVYWHGWIPHVPQNTASDCSFKRSFGSKSDAHHQTLECASHMIRMLVDRLRELDRLDSSLIIVHSDHGFYYDSEEMAHLGAYSGLKPLSNKAALGSGLYQANSAIWPNETVETRSHALLLVRYPGSRSFEISEKPAQMIDLAPTIAEFAGLKSEYQGISLPRLGDKPARKRVFFASNKLPNQCYPRVFSRYEFDETSRKFVFAEDLAPRWNAESPYHQKCD